MRGRENNIELYDNLKVLSENNNVISIDRDADVELELEVEVDPLDSSMNFTLKSGPSALICSTSLSISTASCNASCSFLMTSSSTSANVALSFERSNKSSRGESDFLAAQMANDGSGVYRCRRMMNEVNMSWEVDAFE